MAEVDFRLAAPVIAGSGQSLLLPLFDRTVPARRVALFQPASDPVHPLVALEITNNTQGALPPGLLTLFDTAEDGQAGYVGDARLPATGPGEQRLASFALDLGVTIDTQTHSTEHLAAGTIAHGLLTLQQRDRTVTDYRVTTPKHAARTIVIEQPKTPDDPLVTPTGPSVTTTPDAYRVTQDVPAGTTQTVELATERTGNDTRSLADLDRDSAVLFTSNTELAEPIRRAIQHAADLRADADRQKADLAALRKHLGDLTADQGRIRQNLYSVPANSALQHRYFTMMEKQETELEDLHTQITAGEKQAEQADDAVAAYIAGLEF